MQIPLSRKQLQRTGNKQRPEKGFGVFGFAQGVVKWALWSGAKMVVSSTTTNEN